MKKVALTLGLILFSIVAFANDVETILEIERDGFVVNIVNFTDGDKIKLFEVESGDHILTKTTDQLDLSLLPIGKYLIENTTGKSIIVERTSEELHIESDLEEDIWSVEDSEGVNMDEDMDMDEDSDMDEDVDINQELENYYANSSSKVLEIDREGNIVTVVNFEDGDMIKLFEVKNTVHVLSKTTRVIDLSQLPSGVYFLENNKGESVVIEKFAGIDEIAEL